MLVPKRAKYKKQQKGRVRGKAHKGVRVSFGEYGLLAEKRGLITSRQIEAARRAITHYTQRGGRLWIRIFPHKPITKKPAETRMGGGKGDVFEFVAQIKPGRMLFEMGGVTKDIAFSALKLASHKLNIKTRIVVKEEYNL
ncbi:MAG: 50S ribosomal protein L16 [Candidatus Levybacteria bacterium]|nr:50S ribosomal protein L16 [Candidatus Levybacteria bacterium]